MYKISFLLLAFSLLLACSKSTQKQEATAEKMEQVETKKSMRNFDWLLNKWKRVGEEPGNFTFENWTKVNDSTYNGWSYALASTDTVFQEHMNLLSLNGAWQLQVITPEEAQATIFTMSQYTDSSFTAENPSHDFPTKIVYIIARDTLKAAVSNNEMLIDFSFVANE